MGAMQRYKAIFKKMKEIRTERNQMIYDILIKHCDDMVIALTEIMESAQVENNSVVANEAESILLNLISDRLYAQFFIDANDLKNQ